MSLLENTNLSFFTKLANQNRRLFLPLIGLGIALWVFEVSPVLSQDLQLGLPEKSGPVEHPIPQDSEEKDPQAIPEKKVPPQAEPVQKAPAMVPQKKPVDSVKQKPLPKKRPAQIFKGTKPKY